jgi:hypothetical protein
MNISERYKVITALTTSSTVLRDVRSCVAWEKLPDVLEKRAATIFTVEEYSEK